MRSVACAAAFALVVLAPELLQPANSSIGFKGLEIGAPASKVEAVLGSKGLHFLFCEDFTKPITDVSTKIPNVGECYVGQNTMKDLAKVVRALRQGKSTKAGSKAIQAKIAAYDRFRSLGTVPDEEEPSKPKTIYATRIKVGFESSKLAKIMVDIDLNEFNGPYYPLAIQELLIQGNNAKYGDPGKLDAMTTAGWDIFSRTRQPLRHRVGVWKTGSGGRSEIWLSATKGLTVYNDDGTSYFDPDNFFLQAQLTLSDELLGDYFDKSRDERPEPTAEPTAPTKPNF